MSPCPNTKSWLFSPHVSFIKPKFIIDQKDARLKVLIDNIKSEMAQFLKGETYEGEIIHFDKEKKYYFLIKGEDIPQSLEEAQDGIIKQRISHPVYEIGFVYNYNNGLINTFYEDGNKVRKKLLESFTQNILNLSSLKCNKSFFNLNTIWQNIKSNKAIEFGHNPSLTPSITNIKVRSIKLMDCCDYSTISFALPPGNKSGQINLQSKIAKTLGNKIESWSLDSVQCIVYYKSYDKTKTLNKRFTITASSTCTLGHDDIDGEIKAALQRAGIINMEGYDR